MTTNTNEIKGIGAQTAGFAIGLVKSLGHGIKTLDKKATNAAMSVKNTGSSVLKSAVDVVAHRTKKDEAETPTEEQMQDVETLATELNFAANKVRDSLAMSEPLQDFVTHTYMLGQRAAAAYATGLLQEAEFDELIRLYIQAGDAAPKVEDSIVIDTQ